MGGLNRFFISEYFPAHLRRRVYRYPFPSLNRFFISEYFPASFTAPNLRMIISSLNRFFISEYFPAWLHAVRVENGIASQSLLHQRILSGET